MTCENWNSKINTIETCGGSNIDLLNATDSGIVNTISGVIEITAGKMSNDGLTAFFAVHNGAAPYYIDAYTLSAANDLTTMGAATSRLTVPAGDDSFGTVQTISLSDDGLKFGYANLVEKTNIYDLTDANDLDPSTLNNSDFLSDSMGHDFNADGSKLLVANISLNRLEEYSLAVNYDVTAKTLIGTYALTHEPWDCKYSADGSYIYTAQVKASDQSNYVTEIEQTSPFTLSTAQPEVVRSMSDYFPNGSPIYGVFFASDDSAFFAVGTGVNIVKFTF